jgi:hypothetical protein
MRSTSLLVINTEKKLSSFLEVDVDLHGRPLYQRVINTVDSLLMYMIN